MINLNVFSEEKAWSKKLNKKDFFFKNICNAFPKKYKFLNKTINKLHQYINFFSIYLIFEITDL